MKATWDKLENNWMQFEVEVEAKEFSKSVDTAFKKVIQQVNIPGFRKGKAPRAMFERMYGKDTIVQEAMEQILPQAYGAAIVQGNVEPIDQPEIELVQVEDGQPFIFKGKVQVTPEVVLGQVTGLGLEKTAADVSDEQVNEQINTLRDRLAALVTDESGEVKNGSFAVIDFEGFVDDVAFEGGKGENYTLEVGSGSFIPGFEEQLIGAKVGESRDVAVSFPEQYQAEHLAGKPALFKVTVKEVKQRDLPEVNDELAQQVSQFATLEELRADIKNRLSESASAAAERDFQNKVIDAVADMATVEIPHKLVHDKVHEMIHDFEHTLSRQGFTIDMWYQATGKTHDDLHTEFGSAAKKAVKNDLVVAAVAKQEGITVSDADIEAEFDKMLLLYKDQEADIKKLRKTPSYRVRVREGMLVQKTIEHLVKVNAAQG